MQYYRQYCRALIIYKLHDTYTWNVTSSPKIGIWDNIEYPLCPPWNFLFPFIRRHNWYPWTCSVRMSLFSHYHREILFPRTPIFYDAFCKQLIIWLHFKGLKGSMLLCMNTWNSHDFLWISFPNLKLDITIIISTLYKLFLIRSAPCCMHRLNHL